MTAAAPLLPAGVPGPSLPAAWSPACGEEGGDVRHCEQGSPKSALLPSVLGPTVLGPSPKIPGVGMGWADSTAEELLAPKDSTQTPHQEI